MYICHLLGIVFHLKILLGLKYLEGRIGAVIVLIIGQKIDLC